MPRTCPRLRKCPCPVWTREAGLFIGTTALDMLRIAALSVLALKPEGLVSAVTTP